jgi:hypothetical protein
MKRIIVSLAVIACAFGAIAEDKKCDKDKKDCAGKAQSSCCSKKSGASCSSGKSACSQSEVLTSPKMKK